MDCQIYCIEDINGLKYVGSTIQSLQKRLFCHKSNKKTGRYCSSSQLDLDNCEIKLLETCDISHRFEREKYWIEKTHCVNTRKPNFDRKEYMKEYEKEYREKHKEKIKKYREENREKLRKQNKEYRDYRISWGGDIRYHNNNLLKIDVNLFLL